jgi:hypothetical protein
MTATLAHSVRTTGLDLLTRTATAVNSPDGGFSVDPRSGLDVSVGFAVAVYPDREQQISDRVRPADISDYVFRNADVLARSGAVLGGWRDPDDGIAYLDVSRVVATRAEAEALGREYTQKSYYDFAAGKSVPIKP